MELLGTRWLSGEILDFALKALDSKLRKFDMDLVSRLLVGSLSLTQEIQRTADSNDFSKKNIPNLHRISQTIRAGLVRRLLLPAHIGGNHWVLIHVNLEVHVIEYGALSNVQHLSVSDDLLNTLLGDSLEQTRYCPTDAMEAITQWLVYLGEHMTVAGMTLLHGRQSDSHSCGAYVINMAAHSIFGDLEPLLSVESEAFGRARAFNLICKHYFFSSDSAIQAMLDTAGNSNLDVPQTPGPGSFDGDSSELAATETCDLGSTHDITFVRLLSPSSLSPPPSSLPRWTSNLCRSNTSSLILSSSGLPSSPMASICSLDIVIPSELPMELLAGRTSLDSIGNQDSPKLPPTTAEDNP